MSTVRPLPTEPKQERALATRAKLLDAAVDELVEVGSSGFTISGVARRAGVSLGAQQRYFPHRQTLVGEAIQHLAHRHRDALTRSLADVPPGPASAGAALDLVFEQYAGRLFGAMLELSLAARSDPELTKILRGVEREISRGLQENAAELFGADAYTAGVERWWATAMATARGQALLLLMGHPDASVRRQWSSSKEHLLSLLALSSRGV
ncbi:MAG: hypothetical protein QOF76_1978 [Solirubrobacteraceae bacterium]|jgi:AcrR family transcriptional regulator|nr:hypothetical protein [Solirubrobacteraceae bacterium]